MILLLAVVGAAGCAQVSPITAQPQPPVPSPTNSEVAAPAGMVLIESRFLEADTILAAPKIVVLSGREATISILEPVLLPGAKETTTGLTLSILPKLEGTMVRYSGNCTVRRLAQGVKSTTLATLVTREMWFTGEAPLGRQETFLLADDARTPGIQVQICFTLFPAAAPTTKP